NAGTFNHSGTGTAGFGPGVAFNNAGGVINVSGGTLVLGVSGVSNDGTITVAAGSSLDVSGHTVKGSFSSSGAGTVLVSGGLAVAAPGATFNLAPGMFQWTAGPLTGASLTNAGDLTIAGPVEKPLALTLINTGTISYTGSNFVFG